MNVPVSNISDRRNGMIVSGILVLLVFLILRFTYYTMADPPAKDIPLVATTEITQLELEKLVIEGGNGSLGGEGTPSDAPVAPNPKPQIEKVLTKKNGRTEIKTGQSNKTNGEDPNNTATTVKAAPNPFGSGGGGNSGTGSGVFGKDSGPYLGGGTGTHGSGTGTGTGERIRLNNINTDNIEFDQTCVVALKLTVNAEGDVVQTEVIPGKTNTTDQRIINRVAALVKSQIKYNKKAGSVLEKIELKINIKAT